MNPELSHSSYSLFKYIALGRLSPALARPFAPVIPLSCICTVAFEFEFRPRQLAHVFQYKDFFTYNRYITF